VDGSATNSFSRSTLYSYPQVFLKGKDGSTKFWGDWDRFEDANEVGTLAQELGVSVEKQTVVSSPQTQVETTPASKRELPAVADEEPASQTLATTTKTPVETEKAADASPMEAAENAPTSVTDESTPKPATEQGSPTGEAEDGKTTSTSRSLATENGDRLIESDITVYGATGHVGNRVITYLMQKSLSMNGNFRLTIAGRNAEKLEKVRSEFSAKMGHLLTIYPESSGRCVIDVVIADTSDKEGLRVMVARTKTVISCAGPFALTGSNIVAACAQTGADYVDITGEVTWAGEMRMRYGEAASRSGARIISFCGYDSVPSDIAVFTAVQALRDAFKNKEIEIESATTWHHAFGLANAGTIHTSAGMPLNLAKSLFRRVPFLMDDPLVLTHPRTRFDPDIEATRDRMAKAEWANQMPAFHTIFKLGVSAPFFMAVVNAKIVNASAIALNYGPNFVYKERFLPTGFKMTPVLKFVGLLPALIMQIGGLVGFSLLKLPYVGTRLLNWIAPPGSGMSEAWCRAGFAEVYAEASSPVDKNTGCVDRANCNLKFTGDPANWVTSQCVSEAALALILNRDELPARSTDGFGTPAELLGGVLLKRLKDSTIRPVQVCVSVRKCVAVNEWQTFP
jgi:short subunit dehydrogenase-like uncharacterized protein